MLDSEGGWFLCAACDPCLPPSFWLELATLRAVREWWIISVRLSMCWALSKWGSFYVVKEFVDNCKCALVLWPQYPSPRPHLLNLLLVTTDEANSRIGARKREARCCYTLLLASALPQTNWFWSTPLTSLGLSSSSEKSERWPEFLSSLTSIISLPTVELTLTEATVLLWLLYYKCHLQHKWAFKKIKSLIISTW